MEKFTNSYHKCNCCNLRLHAYQYPLNRQTNSRQLWSCISCKRDCRKSEVCKLGEFV